jgi:phosphohistidine phosphatase
MLVIKEWYLHCMKSVLLIRHAKSSWDNVLQKDFDRTLNGRGHKDAPAMAKRLLEKKIKIDTFISSPAIRALTTASYFAKVYGTKEKDIMTFPELYEAALPVFYNVVKKTSNTFNTIAVFAHNPGITDFANSLSNTQIDDMPTCAIYAVQADIEDWKDFEKAKKTFWFFDYPKGLD